MGSFKFNLGDRVALVESDETGVVIGRAEYLHDQSTYFIRYCAADGRQVECWWSENALKPVED